MDPKTDQDPVNPPAAPLQGCDAVEAEIAKYSGWSVSTMKAIAKAENRTCDPLKHNLTRSEDHGVCIGSYGVLQVGCVHYHPGEDINNLATNVSVAYRVWKEQGYKAWTTYNTGKYIDFLE